MENEPTLGAALRRIKQDGEHIQRLEGEIEGLIESVEQLGYVWTDGRWVAREVDKRPRFQVMLDEWK